MVSSVRSRGRSTKGTAILTCYSVAETTLCEVNRALSHPTAANHLWLQLYRHQYPIPSTTGPAQPYCPYIHSFKSPWNCPLNRCQRTSHVSLSTNTSPHKHLPRSGKHENLCLIVIYQTRQSTKRGNLPNEAIYQTRQSTERGTGVLSTTFLRPLGSINTYYTAEKWTSTQYMKNTQGYDNEVLRSSYNNIDYVCRKASLWSLGN
jgi:hypothetical protein